MGSSLKIHIEPLLPIMQVFSFVHHLL
ncbi:hypothetical protein LINPERHAP2_LOCUS40967 [Linum perenne]